MTEVDWLWLVVGIMGFSSSWMITRLGNENARLREQLRIREHHDA